MNMFCFQCQETAKNQGCTVRGVCGKTDDVAHLQDLLIWLLKGMSFYGVKARELNASDPETDLFVAQSLFSTITNVNFDPERFVPLVDKALALRDRLQARFLKAYQQAHGRAFSEPLPEMATWVPEKGDVDEFVQKGATVGVMADPNQIEQALMNLVVNAFHAMPNGGKISIETKLHQLDTRRATALQNLPAGPYVALTVKDNGCGAALSQCHR